MQCPLFHCKIILFLLMVKTALLNRKDYMVVIFIPIFIFRKSPVHPLDSPLPFRPARGGSHGRRIRMSSLKGRCRGPAKPPTKYQESQHKILVLSLCLFLPWNVSRTTRKEGIKQKNKRGRDNIV